MSALQPTPSLLCRLGSIAVHADEMMSPTGHGFDKIAMQDLLNDAEVKAWLAEMDKLAMIPRKRTLEDVRLASQPRPREDRGMTKKHGGAPKGKLPPKRAGKLPKQAGPIRKQGKRPAH